MIPSLSKNNSKMYLGLKNSKNCKRKKQNKKAINRKKFNKNQCNLAISTMKDITQSLILH